MPFSIPTSTRSWRAILPWSLGVASVCVASALSPAEAHEAWLLTPDEVAVLARMPMPDLFTNVGALSLAALIGGTVACAAMIAGARLKPHEEAALAPIAARAADIGPLVVRLGVALMLGLGALGALPRHGTAIWTQPTLFVPDMQLSLVPGWGWMEPVALALSVMLCAGLVTRLAGVAVIALALMGMAAFGPTFLSYAPHFIAPGLILAIYGGGALSMDRAVGLDKAWQPGRRVTELGWTATLVATGLGFVHLAVAYKLMQPTLLMAILDHGDVPLLGLPLDLAALIMAGVELIAGAVLALGRLVRPVALFLICAFTFFAVTIGETPLFHANLYGLALILVMAGRSAPWCQSVPMRPAPVRI